MFKEFGQKVLVAFASAQITAEDNKVKKADKKKQKKEAKAAEEERRASVDCPYCKEHYESFEIYRKAYKPEGFKLKEREIERLIYLSFIKCRNCSELFGIEEYHTSVLFHSVRTPFILQPAVLQPE